MDENRRYQAVADQAEIHRMARSKYVEERKRAVDELKNNIPILKDKKQAWDELHRLTSDDDSNVRIAANHSSGKVCIFRASEAENENGFRKEMENALGFFEKASKEATYFNPTAFCLPFYRSFFALTFKKEEAEAEVQKYLSEARSAVQGSESKEKLLEAVENLGNALKEVQKAQSFDALKSDLNAYRRYCDRTCELLDTMDETAPGASRLIRRGLPIIDERIKEIIAEIQEKAKAACQRSIGTPAEEIACSANREIQKWRVEDPQQMTWAIESLIFTLHSKIPHNPENKHIHDKIEEIRKEEDMPKQYQMIAILVALIPSVHIGNITNSGSQSRTNINSDDKSINIIEDKISELKELIEKDYKKEDKNELVQTVHQMKQYSCDSSKRTWLKEKLGWIITRTSEIASISSFAITLKQML